MGKRVYPLNHIRYWYAYDIDEVCRLYKGHNLHPQTVRKWLKTGLKAIDGGKPVLIYGNELKRFLGNQNNSGKRKTQFDKLPCFTCQDERSPFRKQVQLEHINGFVRVKAHCLTCKKVMNKSYKLTELPQLRSCFDVVGVLELYDYDNSTVNTHIPAYPQSGSGEPPQMELF